MIKVTVLGSSSAMAAFGRHPSAQVLQDENDHILIDCGEGTQFQLQHYKLKIHKLDHILISHLHGDHFFGLIGLLSSMHLMGRKRTVHLYGPQNLSEILTTQLKYSNSVLNYQIEFHPLKSDKRELILETKTLKISSFPLNHRIDCYGFRFDEKVKDLNLNKDKIPEGLNREDLLKLKRGENILKEDGSVRYYYKDYTYQKHEETSYAYCSDTRFDESLINEIKNVDLLYHEATFLHDLVDRAIETFHTTAKEAGEIARKADVGKLMIGHFSTRYKNPDVLLDEAKLEFDETILATEGQTVSVTKP